MPNNTLTPAQMNTILHDQFREVEALGFTADGVNKVFESRSRSEGNFFEKDDTDSSLLSFDSNDSIFTDPASKRPRLN